MIVRSRSTPRRRGGSPIIPSHSPDRRAAAKPSPPLALLVVDTDPRMGRALARLLTSQNLTISLTRVSDVGAAIAATVNGVPDLTVVTLGPSADRHDLAAVTRLSTELDVPVIALSARDGLREPALRSGAAAFIHHGMSSSEVLDTILTLVEQHPSHDSSAAG